MSAIKLTKGQADALKVLASSPKAAIIWIDCKDCVHTRPYLCDGISVAGERHIQHRTIRALEDIGFIKPHDRANYDDWLVISDKGREWLREHAPAGGKDGSE